MSQKGKRRLLAISVVLLIAGYVAAFGGEYSVIDVRRARAELVSMQEELDSLRLERQALQAQVDSLENDRFLLERLAREEYGMIREGDLLYRFVEVDDTADAPDPESR